MVWLVTPRARTLSWSTSRRRTLTCSFQLSLTPRMLVLARTISLAWSAHCRTCAAVGPTTQNCTGYGTGGPLGRWAVGQEFHAEEDLGEFGGQQGGQAQALFFSRCFKSLGSTTAWLTLLGGKT